MKHAGFPMHGFFTIMAHTVRQTQTAVMSASWKVTTVWHCPGECHGLTYEFKLSKHPRCLPVTQAAVYPFNTRLTALFPGLPR